jgi:hypothetical protein
MSRAAVFEALVNDSVLNGLGINENSVFHNYSLEERPIAFGPFIILRWGDTDRPPWAGVKAPVRLVLWAHLPLEVTTDFSRLEKILDACDNALKSVEDVSGSDGYTVTCVRATGRSGDFKDDGFQTISKNSGYEVLSRTTEEIYS